MSQSLNPMLYRRLERRFGVVIVSKQGERFAPGGTPKDAPQATGEYLRVSCPFCNDTRRRLWINHMWGVDNKHWGLAICFNADCLRAKPSAMEQLRHWVYLSNGPITWHDVRPGKTTPVPRDIALPEDASLLSQLGEDHVARRYMTDRRLPVNRLTQYGVCYCQQSAKYPHAAGRIIFPVNGRDGLKGWQARAPQEGVTPKYYNPAGMGKSRLLMGEQQAAGCPFAICVEGPTDMLAIGPPAVAIMGKSMSDAQMQMLARWKTVILALDAEAQIESEEILNRLRYKTRCVRVQLTDGDPADILRCDNSMDRFWRQVYSACCASGLDIDLLTKT